MQEPALPDLNTGNGAKVISGHNFLIHGPANSCKTFAPVSGTFWILLGGHGLLLLAVLLLLSILDHVVILGDDIHLFFLLKTYIV